MTTMTTITTFPQEHVTVKDLITALLTMPLDMEVKVYDSGDGYGYNKDIFRLEIDKQVVVIN